MKRRDIWLIAIVLAAAAVLAVIFAFARRSSSGGRSTAGNLYAVARVNGETWGRWSLGEDQVIEIDTSYGHNQLTIAGGAAFMTEADCPDRYCMEMGKASQPGSTIVCLPHRLVIEIVRDENAENSDSALTPDAVTK